MRDRNRVDPSKLPASAVDLDWDCLPSGLKELKGVVGPGAALAICAAFGGRALYVPADPGPDHPLVRLLGESAAKRLCSLLAGDRLHVPKMDAVTRQLRVKEIHRRRKKGSSVTSLAREFNLTQRRVHQILGEDRPDKAA